MPSRFVPAGQVEALVWDDLCRMLTEPAAIPRALERTHGGHWLSQELQARQDGLRRGQADIGRQIERLTEVYLAGVVGLAEYRRRRRDLERREGVLAAQARQLEAQLDHQAEIARLALNLDAFCRRVRHGLAQASREQKRQLVEWLVARVVVADGEVEIRYVIPTTPAAEAGHLCHLRSDYRERLQPAQAPPRLRAHRTPGRSVKARTRSARRHRQPPCSSPKRRAPFNRVIA